MIDKYIFDFEKPILEKIKEIDKIDIKNTKSPDEAVKKELAKKKKEIIEIQKEIYSKLNSWQRVQISRHPQRPFFLDYLKMCSSDFLELHGDRCIGDDNSMPGGLATISDIKCILIGQQKGRTTKENIKRNFGSAHPEGYRKAHRFLKLAEKFNLPFVSFIDTPGAYPGIQSEERNIAESIARNLRDMMTTKTFIISIIIGEGGSGGALGIGVADRVIILENAYYSVISPEGCAAILWKDRKKAPEASEALKLTASDLKKNKIVDTIIPEPLGGAHHDPKKTADSISKEIIKCVTELKKLSTNQLLNERYDKFRKLGFC